MKNSLKAFCAMMLLAIMPVAVAQNVGSDAKKTAKASSETGHATKKTAVKTGDATTLSPEQIAAFCITTEGQDDLFGRWDEQNKVCTPLTLPKKQSGEYSIYEMFSAGTRSLGANAAQSTVHCDLCTTWCRENLVCDPRCHYLRVYACGTHSCNCH